MRAISRSGSTRRREPRGRSVLALTSMALALSLTGPSARAAETRWIAPFGMTQGTFAAAVAHDDSGVYVVGGGDGRFPDGTHADTSNPAFVRKYDFDGQLLWSREFGTSQYNWASAVAVRPGGILIAGMLHGARYG